MKTRTIIAVALAIFAIGIAGCNMGPGPDTEMDMEMGEEYADVESELIYVDPPPCYTVRHYLRWSCVDGEWIRVFVDRQDTWCDGMLDPTYAETTDCYQEFYLQDCNSGGYCGGSQIVCPPPPSSLCYSRPSFQFPTEFARVRL